MENLSRRLVGAGVGFFLALVVLGGLTLAAPSSHLDHGPETHRKSTRQLLQLYEAAFESYRMEYGLYPSGDLQRMTKILLGDNPFHIVYLELPAHCLNVAGQPTDPWRTPLHVGKSVQGKPPQLWSAGPDKSFGTEDDIRLDPF